MSSVLIPHALPADLRKINEILARSGLTSSESFRSPAADVVSPRAIRNFRAGDTYPSFDKK